MLDFYTTTGAIAALLVALIISVTVAGDMIHYYRQQQEIKRIMDELKDGNKQIRE